MATLDALAYDTEEPSAWSAADEATPARNGNVKSSAERVRPASAGVRGSAGSSGRVRPQRPGTALRESRDNVSPGRSDKSAAAVREARGGAGLFFAVRCGCLSVCRVYTRGDLTPPH